MNEQQLYLESLYMALPQAGSGDHNETAAYYLAWICAYTWNVIASLQYDYLNYGYMNWTNIRSYVRIKMQKECHALLTQRRHQLCDP